MTHSFNQKSLRVTLLLNEKNPAFDKEGNNTIVFEGLRVIAQIQSGNGSVSPFAKIQIFNLNLNAINQLTKIKWNTDREGNFNFVKLEANINGEYSTVYEGTIHFAYPNFGSVPDVVLTIDSSIAMNHQINAVAPTSYKGEVDVAQAINALCQQMGMRFENNGVNAKVSNPYLPQTALEQVRALCTATNTSLYMDLNTIAITPQGKAREVQIPVISPQSGLIGYPTPLMQGGVTFSCLYDPLLKFGGLVEIQNSLIEAANGRWLIQGLSLSLESGVPNGKWQADIQAFDVQGGPKIAK